MGQDSSDLMMRSIKLAVIDDRFLVFSERDSPDFNFEGSTSKLESLERISSISGFNVATKYCFPVDRA